MAEYCEYIWDPTRGHVSTVLARSIYEEEARFDKGDKKLAIRTVRAILREMPDVGKINVKYAQRAITRTNLSHPRKYLRSHKNI